MSSYHAYIRYFISKMDDIVCLFFKYKQIEPIYMISTKLLLFVSIKKNFLLFVSSTGWVNYFVLALRSRGYHASYLIDD